MCVGVVGGFGVIGGVIVLLVGWCSVVLSC